MNYEAKMRQHELARGGQIGFSAKTLGQLPLLLAAQNGNTADPVQISVKASQRTG
jgi:hypothetical protein